MRLGRVVGADLRAVEVGGDVVLDGCQDNWCEVITGAK